MRLLSVTVFFIHLHLKLFQGMFHKQHPQLMIKMTSMREVLSFKLNKEHISIRSVNF